LILRGLALLSLDRALSLADRVGDLLYVLLRGTRKLALQHIEMALADSVRAKTRERIVRASFRNVARCFCELAKFDVIRERLDDYVEVEGWEHVTGVLAQGKGAIVITGHIGNWELLAAYFAIKGVPVAAIARRIYNPRINDLICEFRARSGVKTILRESPSASREILQVLRAQGVLAMVIDQDTKAPSISVPFFGRMARTPVAAASLAIRREVPVVAVFAQRRPQGGHRLLVLPPIAAPRTGDRKTDVLALTKAFNEILEKRIRKNPAEWVWWHRRWRREPIPHLDLDPRFQY
jgi:KDO2-lipid IV(A) lauroyltransferase